MNELAPERVMEEIAAAEAASAHQLRWAAYRITMGAGSPSVGP